MQRIATASEIQEIESRASQVLGLSTRMLMERAGTAVAQAAMELVPAGGSVLIVSGKGNNGGDGFVAARVLSKENRRVSVFALADERALTADARDAFQALPKEVHLLSLSEQQTVEQALGSSDLIIDAIFGFGLSGAVRGRAGEIIEAINCSCKTVLAVDIPSGVIADTGAIAGPAVFSDVTLTFFCPKFGLVSYPGASRVGKLMIADLGVPQTLIDEGAKRFIPDDKDVGSWLPRREPEVHKKDVGRVLVVAGSVGMTGAAALAAEAAMRAGAGLTILAAPATLLPVLETKVTEVICIPLPESPGGSLGNQAYDTVKDLADQSDATLIGPGLAVDDQTAGTIFRLIEDIPGRLLVDASALRRHNGRLPWEKRKGETIVTPHPGEMARLLGSTVEAIQSDRLGTVEQTAREWGITVLLKGARSIVGGEDRTVLVPKGNPGMATAGAGDSLAGFIASFWAQGVPAFEAAALATYLHALAGDLAADQLTEYCLIASDLIAFLPRAIKQIV